MTCFPEVQKKAQLEIDTIIGSDRLPTAADRDNLPYIHALCLEVYRWSPVGPLGVQLRFRICTSRRSADANVAVPHRLMEDDVYEGYYFPKGSIVIPNVWCGLCCVPCDGLLTILLGALGKWPAMLKFTLVTTCSIQTDSSIRINMKLNETPVV